MDAHDEKMRETAWGSFQRYDTLYTESRELYEGHSLQATTWIAVPYGNIDAPTKPPCRRATAQGGWLSRYRTPKTAAFWKVYELKLNSKAPYICLVAYLSRNTRHYSS